jgi:pyruvate dehydrogenase E1 component alpha subunit
LRSQAPKWTEWTCSLFAGPPAARSIARRAGEGPFILEMKTYRYRGHSMSDPAKYRSREEVAEMRDRHDPIDMLKRRLLERGEASEEDLRRIETDVKEIVNDSAEFAQTCPEPDPSELWTDVLAEI